MSTFDIYRNEKNKPGKKGKTTLWGPREIEAVKHGFSWPGFILAAPWAFLKRLYFQGIVLGIVAISAWVAGDNWLVIAGSLATFSVAGLKGNSWRRSELTRRGFVLVETVEATSARLALGLPPGMLYYVGRGLQVLGMAALLESILIAGPLGPSPRIFGFGVATFLIGWFLTQIY